MNARYSQLLVRFVKWIKGKINILNCTIHQLTTRQKVSHISCLIYYLQGGLSHSWAKYLLLICTMYYLQIATSCNFFPLSPVVPTFSSSAPIDFFQCPSIPPAPGVVVHPDEAKCGNVTLKTITVNRFDCCNLSSQGALDLPRRLLKLKCTEIVKAGEHNPKVQTFAI